MSYRSPQELVEAFRDWHVPIRAYEPDGTPWYAHTTAGGWNPHGILHHHTAGSASQLTSDLSRRAMLRILRNGRTGLPGPLCHFSPAMDGPGRAVLWLVGWGNTNHAGLGDATNLAQVVAGTYTGRAPQSDAADGNTALYGFEYQHPGDGTPWPDELLEVGHRAAAAICDAHGWRGGAGARANLEHREWTPRKIDRSWRGDVRAAVAEQLQAGPARTMSGDEDMSWTERLPLIGSSKRKPAGVILAQTHYRAAGARASARDAAQAAQGAREEVAALRAELPDLIEHAAAAGAKRALAESVVQVDVNVRDKVGA